MWYPHAAVDSENSDLAFIMEHEGIFSAESPFAEFSRLLGYRDFLNNKSNVNNAFGVHLSMPFLPPKVQCENT